MIRNRDLRAPWLPQMNNNGIIDGDDLVDGYVYVLVPAYSNMALGDQIVIHFDTLYSMARVVTAETVGKNIEFLIPEDQVPDGIYFVYYTATDVAQNPSTSSKTIAIVSRDGTRTLEQPEFLDATDGVLLHETVLQNEGTHVHVPSYNGMEVGDSVELNYLLYDTVGELISEASFSEMHTVVYADLLAGYQTLIPESKIFLPDGIRAVAFYRVTRSSDGSHALSFESSVVLNGEVNFLEKPIFKDAINGWLTKQTISQGIRIYINAYADMAAGDEITFIWSGYDNSGQQVITGRLPYFVSASDVGNNVVNIILSAYIAERIEQGLLDVYYKVTDQNGIYHVSYTGSVFIDLLSEILLPAPIFTQAIDNIIQYNDIVTDNAVKILLPYTLISPGDQIALTINGADESGESVPGADYENTFTAVQAGSQSVNAPQNIALAVGNNGTLEARYSVLSSAAGEYSSYVQSALIANVPKQEFILRGTRNSPVYDSSAINVTPFNYGFIKAPVGNTYNVTCSAGATILESGNSSFTFTIDASGVQRFRVQSVILGNINLQIYNVINSAEKFDYPLFFSNYKVGQGRVNAIANTTNALSDGLTPCSIYIKIDTTGHNTYSTAIISSLTVSVPYPLYVEGYGMGESVIVPLHLDGSAQINILSLQDVISASVIITSKDSDDVYEVVDLSFSGFN